MSNKKISQLTTAGALDGSELVPIVQGGATVKTTINDIVAGGSRTWFDLTSTISGTTHTLSHIPVSKQGYYLEGQRLFIGGKITSIVGTLVTFDDDYTGFNFTETYEY